MKGIRIINPGMHSTIQDSGRIGFREFGLPLSGVMDINSFHLSNWLVRNNSNEAVIETIFPGLEIEFLSSTIFAVTGANMTPVLNGEKIQNWKSYRAKSGMHLALTRLKSGSRSYISFSGGFRIDPQLNSLSTYVKGKLGGYRGRELRKGDIIPLYPGIPYLFKKRALAAELIPEYGAEIVLKVLPGVDYDLFDQNSIEEFLEGKFTVSNNSDRMGLRLEGKKIIPKTDKQIISYGIHPGAIQVSGDGNPIIMGMDCQTTGGYPQIANIVSADLPELGQIKPGDQISFSLTTNKEALKLLKIYSARNNKLFGTSSSICTDCVEKRR